MAEVLRAQATRCVASLPEGEPVGYYPLRGIRNPALAHAARQMAEEVLARDELGDPAERCRLELASLVLLAHDDGLGQVGFRRVHGPRELPGKRQGILGQIGTPLALELALELASGASRPGSFTWLLYRARLGDVGATRQLVENCRRGSPPVRSFLYDLLEEGSDPLLVEWVMEQARRGDPAYAADAALALARIGHPAAVPALIDLLQAPMEWERWPGAPRHLRIAWALQHLTGETAPGSDARAWRAWYRQQR